MYSFRMHFLSHVKTKNILFLLHHPRHEYFSQLDTILPIVFFLLFVFVFILVSFLLLVHLNAWTFVAAFA